jgi:cobalt/nickel transport system ATP-binding protein
MDGTMSDVVIRLENICFGYDQKRLVLEGVDLELKKGQSIGLVGSNGSGKTTLLHLIVGLLKPSSGLIEIFGKPRKQESDFLEVRKKVGLLFQDADDQLFCPTVAEDVAFGPFNLGKSRSEVNQIVEKTLKSLGIESYKDRVTYKLSGGEKRMVSLATVLAMEPEVLLLDEPTYGLDEESEARILDILAKLPLAKIIISHHRGFLKKITDNIIRLQNSKIQQY